MKVNVGYYQSWAIYRQNGCHRVSPDDIDVDGNGYTHLIYTFASINSNSQLEPWGGDYSTEVSQFRAFTNLKKTNANLKTLIAVGGWTFNDPGATLTRFSDTASTAARRATFAKSCVDFCRTYNFDGVDLDWEYPGDTTRGGDPADMKNFVLLVKAIRSAFDDADEGLQLTMAIPIASFRLEAGYNLPALAGGVNFFNLMTYDIYGTWDSPKVVGANTDMPYIFNAIKYILNTGVSSSKLVLGLAAYGRSYNMEDNSCTAAGCPFSSGGVGGCAGETGFMPYFTIEQYVKSGNYKSLRFNGSTGTMELVIDGNVMISYDSPATMRIKYDFASKACLRGVMWWAVDMKKNPIVLDGNR
jgi:chitinase